MRNYYVLGRINELYYFTPGNMQPSRRLHNIILNSDSVLELKDIIIPKVASPFLGINNQLCLIKNTLSHTHTFKSIKK